MCARARLMEDPYLGVVEYRAPPCRCHRRRCQCQCCSRCRRRSCCNRLHQKERRRATEGDLEQPSTCDPASHHPERESVTISVCVSPKFTQNEASDGAESESLTLEEAWEILGSKVTNKASNKQNFMNALNARRIRKPITRDTSSEGPQPDPSAFGKTWIRSVDRSRSLDIHRVSPIACFQAVALLPVTRQWNRNPADKFMLQLLRDRRT